MSNIRFPSRATAEEAIEQLRKQPGFKDYPNGFSVDEYKIDQLQWEEGFVHGGPTSGGPKAKLD